MVWSHDLIISLVERLSVWRSWSCCDRFSVELDVGPLQCQGANQPHPFPIAAPSCSWVVSPHVSDNHLFNYKLQCATRALVHLRLFGLLKVEYVSIRRRQSRLLVAGTGHGGYLRLGTTVTSCCKSCRRLCDLQQRRLERRALGMSWLFFKD
ncbi:hypothetical protein Vadar_022467 [Vaccinium darrowii]|uniref:Uncharacterized protein n=1 Tax=Vaccinium darrowii TaxID=229202 RepID=A0ACB7X302_9ERIC|nr:hypothetical protein Vadar_022467 [Vaccinium darrowii]